MIRTFVYYLASHCLEFSPWIDVLVDKYPESFPYYAVCITHYAGIILYAFKPIITYHAL